MTGLQQLVNGAKYHVTRRWQTSKPPFSTGFLVECSNCHSIFSGRVIYIGTGKYDLISVIVLSNSSECISYSYLKDIQVNLNDFVEPGTLIGHPSKNGVLVEYAIKDSTNRSWPLRVNDITYYRQDLSFLMNGEYAIQVSRPITRILNSSIIETIDLTSAQAREFKNVKGEINRHDDFFPTSIHRSYK